MSATSGKRRLGLTLKFFGASALVVIVVLGGTLALASAQASRTADRALERRLQATGELVARLLKAETAKLASGAKAATQNPNFIAEFHTGGSSFLDLARTFREILGADYVSITNNQAVLEAKTDDPAAVGYRFDPPMVVRAMRGEQADGYVDVAGRRLYLLVATPLREPGSGVVLGVVVATHEVTDSLAGEIKRASGSDIVFYVLDSLNHPVVAASTVRPSAELSALLSRVEGGGGGAARGAPLEATLGDVHLVGISGVLQNVGSREPLGGYLALQSRDAELAGFRRTQRTLLLAGLIGLMLALAGSYLVARWIGRPVRELARAAGRVADGDYEAAVEVRSRDEIGDLASAFQRMVDELKAKQQLVRMMSADTETQRIATSGGDAAAPGVALPPDLATGVLAPGVLFAGRYEIRGVVGMGGMGVVYRAWDAQLSEPVAIKMLRMDAAQAEPAALDRFKQEIRLARKITHRNVVRTHDIGEVGGAYFITMELVEGQSLKHLIEARGPLPANAALTVGKQLCRALEVAHEQGVIHRDIKPQNLIVEPSGTLKVMDFGIARLARRSEGMTQAGIAVGTPEYMAPEQLLGGEVSFRTDLYAVGAVLFEAVTGRTPFVAESPVTLVAKLLEEVPPPPRSLRADLPETLSVLILRTLSKDPADRPQSASLLFEALDAIAV